LARNKLSWLCNLILSDESLCREGESVGNAFDGVILTDSIDKRLFRRFWRGRRNCADRDFELLPRLKLNLLVQLIGLGDDLYGNIMFLRQAE